MIKDRQIISIFFISRSHIEQCWKTKK